MRSRGWAGVLVVGILIAVLAPRGTSPAMGDDEKRDYTTNRVQVVIYVDGLEEDDHEKQLTTALKAKFKRKATTGYGSGVLLKVRHNVSVRLSDIQRVLTTVGRRNKGKWLWTNAELKGKVQLKISTGKVKPKPDQVAQIVAKLQAIKGVVVQRPPTKSIASLTLICSAPGTDTDAINEAIVGVLELGDETQTVKDVTFYGPGGRDPRRKPVVRKGEGSKH